MLVNDIMSAGHQARIKRAGQGPFIRRGITGSNVVCCVIDTGVVAHESISEVLIAEAKPDPMHGNLMGHGTWVATRIAGKHIGVAPGMRILPYARKSVYLDSVVAGLQFARAWRGPNGERVNIVNISASSEQNYADINSEVRRCEDAGILIVCSTGNKPGEDITYPAALPETLAVGAARNDMQPVDWHTWGSMMDVIQFGDNVVVGSSVDPKEYIYQTGTSFSAPTVTGICGLLIDKYFRQNGEYPTPKWVRDTARFMAIDVGVPGPDKKSGAGFLTLDPHPYTTIELKVGSTKMLVDGIEVTLQQAPTIVAATGRTLIPVRAVVEALGCTVEWDDATRKITIAGVGELNV